MTAYLDRIGAQRPAVLDETTLRALHRAHLMTVPFENLSIHLDEPISLAEGDLVSKIVTRRRGGFCYELNGAFAFLLEALGAGVVRVGARVRAMGGWGRLRPSCPRGAPARWRPVAGRRGLRQPQRLPAALCRRAGARRQPAGSRWPIPGKPGDVDVARDGSRSTGSSAGSAAWQTSFPPAGGSRPHRTLISPRDDMLTAHRRRQDFAQRPHADPDQRPVAHRTAPGRRRCPAGRLPRPLRSHLGPGPRRDAPLARQAGPAAGPGPALPLPAGLAGLAGGPPGAFGARIGLLAGQQPGDRDFRAARDAPVRASAASPPRAVVVACHRVTTRSSSAIWSSILMYRLGWARRQLGCRAP